MKYSINKILKTQTGRKMIANLSDHNDRDKSLLSEYSWISEIPIKQKELFEVIYQLVDFTRVELAFKLIKNQKI